MTHPAKIIPAGLASIGIVLCQLHGAPFWVFIMGGNMFLGWPLSIYWEGMSVWLWWEGSRPITKWIPTAFLLFGMVFQSVSPIWNAQEQKETAGDTRETAAGLATKMSVAIVDQERRGWKDTFDKLIDVALEPTPAKLAATPTYRWLPVVPLFGFLAMYLLSLGAITRLRNTDRIVLDPAEQLAAELAARIMGGGKSYRKIQELTGVPISVLSNIVSREQKQNEGKTVLGLMKLKEYSEALKGI